MGRIFVSIFTQLHETSILSIDANWLEMFSISKKKQTVSFSFLEISPSLKCGLSTVRALCRSYLADAFDKL